MQCFIQVCQLSIVAGCNLPSSPILNYEKVVGWRVGVVLMLAQLGLQFIAVLVCYHIA